jgi:tetratricopeptide (TPR) repeat protein
MGRRSCLLVLLVLAGSTRAGLPPLTPEEEQAFRAHYDLAVTCYRKQRYEQAITELKAAQAIYAAPRLHLNLGHAYRHLDRPQEALSHYERYLAEVPELPQKERAVVDEYIAAARRLIEEQAARQRPPPLTRIHESMGGAPSPRPALPLAETGRRSPAPARPRQPAPLYRRWWIWTLVGVAVAGTVTVAVVASQPWDPALPAGAPIHDPKF